MQLKAQSNIVDIFIIGGGVNGAGIARDASGRGLSVVLAEMNDLASATSSSSTKLFHGGLRYLEYFKFRLVREALIEREILLKNMPHISYPMRFILPYSKDMRFDGSTPTSKLLAALMPWLRGKRPLWLIRFGLFIYDHLGGRKILPKTTSIDLTKDDVGKVLHDKFKKAYAYSDCWVDDARLVVLNAQDAAKRGAQILTREKVIKVTQQDSYWEVKLQNMNTGQYTLYKARTIVNAAGPWVGDIAALTYEKKTSNQVRLVRGSHIVTRKLFEHDQCYFFQGEDGRIIFAIPYENEFTLIGTTDEEHNNLDEVKCSEEEKQYLLKFASQYFKNAIKEEDIVWTYSGVRSLYDDGASSSTATTRDYVLSLERRHVHDKTALLSVFGGKITTYRKLSENALQKLQPYFPDMGASWTQNAPLPGGDFLVHNFKKQVEKLMSLHPFLYEAWATRLVRAYGTNAAHILKGAKQVSDLGIHFGASLTEAEVLWLIENEFARTTEDIIWRRSKLGLHMKQDDIKKLDLWMASFNYQSQKVSVAK